MTDDVATLTTQRAEIGLKTPSYQAKEVIWNRINSPTAGITNGYRPLSSARTAHQADARGVALSGGWRAGKSLGSGMEGVAWLPYADLIWLVAQSYDLTRQEFIYMAEGGLSTGLVVSGAIQLPMNKYQPCAMRTITDCIVETRTLADARKSMAARPPDIIIVCEPGNIDDLNSVMELMWGRVAERRGCIWLAGTSDEASEDWYELWDSWTRENPWGGKAFSIPSWENIHRFPKGRQEREFQTYEKAYGIEALMAHYGGIPSSPRDLVLRDYWRRDIHVRDDIEFDTNFPAEIAIDPNYSLGNKYSIELIQWDEATGRIWIADEVAEEGKTHPEMRELCEQKEWWPYVLGGTIDPYAGESKVYGAVPAVSYWEPLNLRTDIRPRVKTTVQAIRQALRIEGDRDPRLLVSHRAERFIWEAARWRQSSVGEPSKRNCDALKGTGYWLVDHFAHEQLGMRKEGDDNIVLAVNDWNME